MPGIETLTTIMGASWLSGIRLYGTVFALGLAHRMGWVTLPGDLDVLANVFVLTVALTLYVAEFVGDKIPLVDSTLDTVHTFAKPAGGALLAYMATAGDATVARTMLALAAGGVTLTTHASKASARVAINASPEPLSNIVTSTAEDGIVLGGLWLFITHPVVLAFCTILFLVGAVWFLRKMGGVFKRLFGRGKVSSAVPGTAT
jgi:hypothetical protein